MSRFYDISDLDFQDFALEAYGISDEVYVEKLAAKNMCRVVTDYTAVEFFEFFGDRKLHKTFVLRDRGVKSFDPIFEVGACTIDATCYDEDFFLWIYIPLMEGLKLISKYKLQPLK